VDPKLLKTEIQKPDYDGMTTAQKVAALTLKNLPPADGTAVSVTREQIRAAFDANEFISLTLQKQNAVLAVLQSDSVFVEGADATLLAAAFAGASNTLPALVQLRDDAIAAASVSIADQIGFGNLPDEALTAWIIKAGA